MSDQLPITGVGGVLAMTGIWTGMWWLVAAAVGLVVVGAIAIRFTRRRGRR